MNVNPSPTSYPHQFLTFELKRVVATVENLVDIYENQRDILDNLNEEFKEALEKIEVLRNNLDIETENSEKWKDRYKRLQAAVEEMGIEIHIGNDNDDVL